MVPEDDDATIARTASALSAVGDDHNDAAEQQQSATDVTGAGRSARQRKASTLYENSFDPSDRSRFAKEIRQYQKQQKEPVNKKRPAAEDVKAAEIAAAAAVSSASAKESKKSKHAAAQAAIVVVPAREKEQLLVEEDFIRTNASKTRRKRVPVPLGASDPLEFQPALRKSIKDCSTLLLDWNQTAAKLVGAVCKVYWEGDNEWFYARVLNYDSRYDRHFVYYFADNTSEWLSIRDEAVFVAEAFVLAKMRGVWPALRFWASP